MKRTFATLGVVGLGLLSVTAPAWAAPDQVTVCHADGGDSWSPLAFNVNGVGGHEQHPTDIIPPTPKLPGGLNWTNAGKLTYIAKCAELPPGETVEPETPPVVEQPPVEVPPVENPPVEQTVVQAPVVETPETPVVVAAVIPPAQQPAVVPPVTVPQAAATVVVPDRTTAAAATTSLGTNQGYNAQTAVGSSNSPSWLAGVGALVAAGAAVAFRRSRRTLPLAG
jgi:outer membrane biosynthesis protein TonB